MEKIVEKIGLYDTLCAVVGGVLAIMSIKLLDISFFRFIFTNVPDSMHLVFLVFVGSLVGILLQEFGSGMEHRKRVFINSSFFRFREYGISEFLNWSSVTKNLEEGDNDPDGVEGTNAVFDNYLEIRMARKKAYALLPQETRDLNKKYRFEADKARYVFQKMYKDVSQREGASTVEMLNSLGSLSRSLCVWFFALALLYIADIFLKWKHNEPFTIPYPMVSSRCSYISQASIVVAALLILSVIMYKRAERYQQLRLRTIVRLYAYYDDNKDKIDNMKEEHLSKPIQMKVEILESKRNNGEKQSGRGEK